MIESIVGGFVIYKVYLKSGIVDVLYLYNFKLEQIIFIYK